MRWVSPQSEKSEKAFLCCFSIQLFQFVECAPCVLPQFQHPLVGNAEIVDSVVQSASRLVKSHLPVGDESVFGHFSLPLWPDRPRPGASPEFAGSRLRITTNPISCPFARLDRSSRQGFFPFLKERRKSLRDRAGPFGLASRKFARFPVARDGSSRLPFRLERM
jgi:hypothetical protein